MEKYIAHGSTDCKEFQSVFQHLESVSKLSGEYAGKIGLSACGTLAGMLHDLGKMSDQFQKYIKGALGLEKNDIKSGGDHAMFGAAYVYIHYHDADRLCYGNRTNNKAMIKITAEILAMVICYHHGGLEDFVNEREVKLLDRINNAKILLMQKEDEWRKILGFDNSKIDELFAESTSEISELMKKINATKSDGSYLFHLLIKFLYSCLIDADRTDTADFMRRFNKNEAMNSNAVECTGIDIVKLWNKIEENLSAYEVELHNRHAENAGACKVNKIRKKIWEDCDYAGKNFPQGIYTLTVPTGGGKTLSSFRFALNHAIRHKKRRIIYILPYISIIEQNARVIRKIIENDDWILEHHCNVISDPVNDSALERRELMMENWDTPIIFSTMVQFLNIFYSTSTQDMRRLHNLSDSVIIFDEIQAIPVKCISMFNEAINFLSDICGCTIILCSATQPVLSDVIKHKINVKGEIIKDVKEKFLLLKRMEVIDQRIKGAMTVNELAGFCRRIITEEDSLLIVMNTKNMAKKFFNALSDMNRRDWKIYYLSTDLCPTHRRDCIEALKYDLSDVNRKEKLICVSTQLIEAGVDISFSAVVRHISGLDSIAQASGRGNRNGENKTGKTYIVQCQEERLGKYLDNIELGEKQTAVVLDNYRNNPLKYREDLLSPEAITEYFCYYYKEISEENKMDYPINGSKQTIYNLLKRRGYQMEVYKRNTGEICPFVLDYPFRTAARAFHVIDENTQSVIVPYKEGKDLIGEIMSCQYGLPERKFLKKLQQFSVNIYKKQFNELVREGGIIKLDNTGVNVLKENYYDEEKMGFDADGNIQMDAVIL